MHSTRKRKGTLFDRKEYPLPTNRDATVWVTDICVLPSGKVVLADFNGRQLLILSKHYRPSGSLELSGSPWSVGVINSNHIVVSMATSSKMIHVINTDGMTVTNTISTGFVCNGVAFSGEELVVTSPDDGSVKMLDTSGNVLWSVTKYGSKTAKTFYFQEPKYLCANADFCRFVVSDAALGVIASINRNGVVLNIVSEKNSRPMGLTLSRTGSVYVCMNGENTVIEYTDYLTQRKVCGTLADGVRLPQAVCYNPAKDELIVCSEIRTDLMTFQIRK